MKILHFADLHLGVETFSHLDAATGLPTRFLDFLNTFDRLTDYAIESHVDLVLFCGDAYKSREPSQTQQREFAKRIRKLSENGIPVFLLIGNHDLPNAIGRATSTEIFDTLGVDNVYVSSKPDVYNIPTRNGVIQVASLPWLRRSSLLSREETKNLDFEAIKQRMEQALIDLINKHAIRLDPSLPAVLAAHVWVAGAQVGSERGMVLGHEPGLLLSNVALPVFDYIALGHIHRHQVLNEQPPVVYSGNIDRIDFGEENDAKGFYIVEIGTSLNGKRPVKYDFHPLETRPFITIEVNIDAADSDPTATVLKAISEKNTSGAIVRLLIEIPSQADGLLRENDIRGALKEAQYFTLARNVHRESRRRSGSFTAEELTPIDALKAYLSYKEISPERAKVLLEYAERLMDENAPDQLTLF